MVWNLKWSCSIYMSLVAITNFRCGLSSEVVALNQEAIQSVDRRFIDIFKDRFNGQVALESPSKEGQPLSILEPPSNLQFNLQKDTLEGQESLQVSTIVVKDPQTAESEHSHHKAHSSGHKKSAGHEGNSGFENKKGYEGSTHGSHAKKEDKGFYDKGGKKWSGGEHKSKFHAKKESGKKGSKGHKLGKKGHHNKGSKTQGFKNVFHKEESGVTSSFYNDVDNKKYSKKYDHLDSYFQSKKGGSEKGSEFEGGKQHASDDKKGFSKKGSAHDDKGGHKSESGKSGHHDHKSSFAKKKGDKGYEGGHGGHDGHASHSNTITITASENANKPAILKPKGSENVPEDMVIAEQNEIKDTKELKVNKRRRKKAREQQVTMPLKTKTQDANSIDELKSDSVLETAIIRNGKQVSLPVSHKVKNGQNDTLSAQVQNLIGSWPELKMFQNGDSSDSDDSQSDSIVTSTTHEPPKLELIVRKKTPRSKGYSYIKKSSTPKFSNCSTDSSQECTTYSKNSRSTVVVEYTDSDYPDNNEDYQEEADSDYEQPELQVEIDIKKDASAVADIQTDSTRIEEITKKSAASTNSIPNNQLTQEALLLLLAQLQKAPHLSTPSALSAEGTIVLTSTIPSTKFNPLAFEIKRRRKSNTPSTVASIPGQETIPSSKLPDYGPLLERRRQNKVNDNDVLIERRKKARELVLKLKMNPLEISPQKEVENVIIATQTEATLTNPIAYRGRSAFRERLANRRERLANLTNTAQATKISIKDQEAELTGLNKMTEASQTILLTYTEKPKAVLDNSPFLVPDDWDSRRLGDTTTVEPISST